MPDFSKFNLMPGAKVGLICPGSPITQEKLETAIENIRSLGFIPDHTPKVLLQKGYLAGSDLDRLTDLHDMYRRQDIDAVWCIRGGYGCTRLLPHIDYSLIRANAKPLIGYSDVTALLNAIHQKTKSPCYHGPVASSTLTNYARKCLLPVIHTQYPVTIQNHTAEQETSILYPGIAQGKLAGGNLSLIAALQGTPFEIHSKNKLVFIEEVGEKPYRIDRMLTQLLDSGFFNNVKGIILGQFVDCDSNSTDSLSLLEVLTDRLTPLKIPTIYGFSFGHIDDQCTFPIGMKAALNTSKQIVTLRG